MHFQKYFSILALSVSVSYSGNSFSQELMIKRGSHLIRGSVFYTKFDKVFNEDSEHKPSQLTRHAGVDLYLQAGVHPRWNLILSGPILIFNSIQGNPTDVSEWGDDQPAYKENKRLIRPGDLELGIRYGFAERERISACFSLYQGMGTGYRDYSSFLNTGYGDYNSRIQFDADFRPSTSLYFGVYMGYNNHQGYSDEFRTGAKISYQFTTALKAQLSGNAIYNFENSSGDKLDYHTGLFQNNAAALLGGIEITYDGKKGPAVFMGVKTPFRAQFYIPTPVFQLGMIAKLQTGNKN